MLRFLLWRLLGLLAVVAGLGLVEWFLRGGLGRVLRGASAGPVHLSADALLARVASVAAAAWTWAPAGVSMAPTALVLTSGASIVVLLARAAARRRRRYVRMAVQVHRTDQAAAEAVFRMIEALHKRLLLRWWRRLLCGQPGVALELHYEHGEGASTAGSSRAWLALTCPVGAQPMIEAALRSAYPNCRLEPLAEPLPVPPVLVRLKKDAEFIRRVKSLDRFEHEREPPVNRVITVMGACGASVSLQLAITPAPVFFERLARALYKQREDRLSRDRRAHAVIRDRSMVEDAELRGGLEVQHQPLFFADIRIGAGDRRTCERVASELRAESSENRLVERGTAIRHGLLRLYRRRLERGEGNPLPPFHRGVFASSELAAIWHVPAIDFTTVPFERTALPLAPAPPGILRPREGEGTLRDALGAVSIHTDLRRQNTAVPGTVEQGKTSFLVATVAEDLRRERCAVIVLDPKGDAADAAISLVPEQRTCTLLDFAHPTCGFNPLAVDAPADVIADYVVAALRNLFTDADIRASSDRYLRNAIIAVLAYDRRSTLWDAARLLTVGEDGYSYRHRVGSAVRALPEFKEISEFFTAELSAQLADARSMTTAKLDAPVNKLARLLNSASIKRVLLNDSLSVDFDRVIAEREVLVVKGALGGMGAGNTSVLMQLLVGMLDAALGRQQDLIRAEERIAVALKVDEAPLVLNRGFAETMALKRSAGLETVACWQTDAQWVDRDIREQLDALFAHRVYFATASTQDARASVGLTMAEFSDTVRPGTGHLSKLGRPDARLHLPKHHAIASWTTPAGRQSPFLARTIPLRLDHARLALHAARQLERGGRHRSDLSQPHWDRGAREPEEPARIEAPAAGPQVGDRIASAPGSERGPRLEASPSERAPQAPAESYRELIELDLAQSVRWAKASSALRPLEPDALDLEMLELILRFRHVLSSQLHRHCNSARAITTTQRRLKRMSDARLVERFQFHRRDGGGVPMCYVATAAGLETLRAAGRLDRLERIPDIPSGSARAADRQRLRRARHDVHVAGWLLALTRARRTLPTVLEGPEESVLSPPQRSAPHARSPIGPADLRLPGGRVPHDFLRADATGGLAAAEQFETLRPDAIVRRRRGGEIRLGGERQPDQGETLADARDLLVELDDRHPGAGAAAKLERYDHFLSGWSVHTRRYGQRREASPLVVILCRDRSRARAWAQAADRSLRACRAYAGEYPFDWEYPGREGLLFVAERDIHDLSLRALAVPRLPPQVRVTQAHGDPRAADVSVESRELPS